MNELLPIVEVCANGFKSISLVDTGCSHSLVSKSVGHLEKEGSRYAINRNTLKCLGVRNVKLVIVTCWYIFPKKMSLYAWPLKSMSPISAQNLIQTR